MTRRRNPKARAVGFPQTFRAFKDRNYRTLWPANVLTYTSRWSQMTLLSWFVLERTDSPWLVALVGFFGMAPMLLLGLVGGVLADSWNRHSLLKATQAASFIAALVMTVVLISGVEQYWHAYPTVLVVGVAWALDMPSRRSIIYDLLGSSGVTNAIALDSVGMSISMMLGPALAGGLITVVGVKGGLVAVTILYAVSLGLIWRLRLPAADRRQVGRRNLAVDLVQGLSYVAGHPALLATVLVTLLMNLLLYPYMHMVPLISRDVLNVGPGLMGVLMAVPGLGSFVGAIVVASATNINYHGRLYMGGSLAALIALLMFSWSREYAFSVAALAALGLGSSGFSTMQATLVMLLARKEMRGKALGTVGLAIGAGPLGALFIGGVASAIDPASAVRLDAALGIGCLAMIGLLMPQIRQRISTVQER